MTEFAEALFWVTLMACYLTFLLLLFVFAVYVVVNVVWSLAISGARGELDFYDLLVILMGIYFVPRIFRVMTYLIASVLMFIVEPGD